MTNRIACLLMLSVWAFTSCSKDNSKGSLTYTIELAKFNIVADGDYHNRADAIASTIGINKALLYAKENGYNRIKFPKGHYPIISEWGFRGNPPLTEDTVGILVPSNLTLDLSEATFRLLPNTYPSYSMFLINNVENVTIIGGHIIGDRYEHVNTVDPNYPNTHTYEFGFGFSIVNSQNITIKDANIEQMTGDAISIGRFPYSPKDQPINNNVIITNCELHDCRRQGISLGVARNTELSHNKIHNIRNGTLPMCGIDVEAAEFKPELCLYTKIHNNHISNVSGAAIACNTGDYVEIYENEMDNWVWIINSIGTRVYKNIFNANRVMVHIQYPETDVKAYDNVFTQKGRLD